MKSIFKFHNVKLPSAVFSCPLYPSKRRILAKEVMSHVSISSYGCLKLVDNLMFFPEILSSSNFSNSSSICTESLRFSTPVFRIESNCLPASGLSPDTPSETTTVQIHSSSQLFGELNPGHPGEKTLFNRNLFQCRVTL